MGVHQEREQEQHGETIIHQDLSENAPGLVQEEVDQDGKQQEHAGDDLRYEGVGELLLHNRARHAPEDEVIVNFLSVHVFETVDGVLYVFGNVGVGQVVPVSDRAVFG